MRERSSHWRSATSSWECPTPGGGCDPCGDGSFGHWDHMFCRGLSPGMFVPPLLEQSSVQCCWTEGEGERILLPIPSSLVLIYSDWQIKKRRQSSAFALKSGAGSRNRRRGFVQGTADLEYHHSPSETVIF